MLGEQTCGAGSCGDRCNDWWKSNFCGVVPAQFLATWEKQVGDQRICQIDLYAIVALRWMLEETLTTVEPFGGSTTKRQGSVALRDLAPSPVMRWLVKKKWFWGKCSNLQLVERVPSFSNIADGPSRSKLEEAMRLLSVSVCLSLSFNHPPELIACLLNS